jgi:hypothetical protein
LACVAVAVLESSRFEEGNTLSPSDQRVRERIRNDGVLLEKM